MFSDCIRISGEIQDRCRVQNRPSADPKTRRIGAQAIGTKKDTPKRTRILPFREFAIRRNPCIHFLQLRAIVAGLLFCRNQNSGPADWTRRDCTTTTEAGFEPDVNGYTAIRATSQLAAVSITKKTPKSSPLQFLFMLSVLTIL